ncbi:MAG: branched-chain amino acid transport system ATP-binding protein, livG [Syntrophus sp. SKADARSKE-3]|nr:branched-chain amino acid transport system ATP-binding protein, livG [Syntrophus sp. SKADARSKE-3]
MAILSASQVSHYFGGLAAVSDFNLDLEPGELMGIIGPNCAGKTTVFNLLSGVYKATEGSISFDGHEIVGRRPDQITALGMARTFQNIRLFKDLTVLDNVRIACYSQSDYNPLEALFRIGRYHRQEREIAKRSMDLLSIFNLEGYAQDISQNLPYGLQRRLEIARALATGPKVLLLDEPAAGMNPAEVIQLMDLIQEIRRQFQLTILLIEHQMQLVMGICERLIVLDFGATIATGVPEAIKNNRKVLEAYLGEEVVY